MTLPTCPLRKPCAVCKKDYGRKYVTNNRTSKPQLQSKTAWQQSEACSRGCWAVLHGQRERARAEKKRRAEETTNAAMNCFLYGK